METIGTLWRILGPASHQSVSRRDDRGGFTRRRITGLPWEGCSAKPESPGTRTFRTPPTPPPQSFMIPTTIP
ncbi:hypothetical protein V1478_012741 [Vespula squamosa]|uniref:Uncharacterized protein n=1 Tax=Vespula squamosa TaxID=30214 RepID=A0ABD2A8T8_VESSQ